MSREADDIPDSMEAKQTLMILMKNCDIKPTNKKNKKTKTVHLPFSHVAFLGTRFSAESMLPVAGSSLQLQ